MWSEHLTDEAVYIHAEQYVYMLDLSRVVLPVYFF